MADKISFELELPHPTTDIGFVSFDTVATAMQATQVSAFSGVVPLKSF